ncbi:hypothetical protein M2650_14350 [Luteimonas sp. SX5]|uniref:Uncharacterized protein n=1 Tax=Luteimonas galliterrae TaxID=2940486 RepID=A0ABT0MLQ4_9GAMM|nr:hypothetical protein [Luteimonas galliterrae]MCL1635807.1 hypothetical protein [Luteimonas galliterrae]
MDQEIARLWRHAETQLAQRNAEAARAAFEAIVARELLDFCGLSWEPSCVAIERNTSAVATASTVQVREPIHQRSVGQWKRYERELEPLRRALRE